MSNAQPAAASASSGASAVASAAAPEAVSAAAPAVPAAPLSIAALEAEIVARRERLAQTIDELTERVRPSSIIQRQTDVAKKRFADVATTPEGELRVERLAAVVAVVAVVGGWLIVRRLRRG
jgi:hypothetical protein